MSNKEYPEWSLVKFKGKFWWTQWLEDYQGRVSLTSLKDRSAGYNAPREKVIEVTGAELKKQCSAIKSWCEQGICWGMPIRGEDV